jgi:hypothetical protein
MKIGFIGCPSSGKTTLAQVISGNLKSRGIQCELITEFARPFVKAFGDTTGADQFYILKKQRDFENAIQTGVLITDSPCYLSYIYSLLNIKSNKDRYYATEILHSINDMYYDLLFYLPFTNEIENRVNKKDDFRIHTEINVLKCIDRKIKNFLDLYDIEYFHVPTLLMERPAWILEKVNEVIK